MVKINRMRFNKSGLKSVLSPLEYDVLRVLWKTKNARVRKVHKSLKDRKVALTSVAVTLDRLHQKGVVSRTVEKGRGGGHYIYSARTSKEEFEASVIDSAVNRIISNFGPVAVNYFHKRFSGRKKVTR